MQKHYAFMLMKIQTGKIPDVTNKLYEIEMVRELFMVTGPYDLLAVIETDNYEKIGETIVEKIQKIAGIEDTETLIAFRTYKYIKK